MLYCEKCQVLSKNGKTCPLCGGGELRAAAAEDPVMLFMARQEEAERIAAAFDDEGIPHMERTAGSGGYFPAFFGRSRTAGTRIFVPFGEVARARGVMLGIGALKDGGEADAAAGEISQGKAEKPTSRGKSAFIRVASALLFLLLVVAVVFASDSIVAGLKSIFH